VTDRQTDGRTSTDHYYSWPHIVEGQLTNIQTDRQMYPNGKRENGRMSGCRDANKDARAKTKDAGSRRTFEEPDDVSSIIMLFHVKLQAYSARKRSYNLQTCQNTA